MTTIIIINAGQSKRMQERYPGIPKALIPTATGNTILGFQLEIINKYLEYINEIVIVVGYKEEKFSAFVKDLDYDLKRKIRFITNVDYSTTDNAYSVLLGLNEIHDDSVIIIDGDILFHHKLYREFLLDEKPNCLVGRIELEVTPEDAKVLVLNDFVKAVGKKHSSNIVYCSLAKFSGEFLKEFHNELSKEEWWRTWYSMPLTHLAKDRDIMNILYAEKNSVMDVDYPNELDDAGMFIEAHKK